jgi:hypothetical protein
MTAKPRPLHAVPSPLKRCLVHDERYETTCRGCAADAKAVS